tara:strand:+ start:502 stop:1446 length:945 start_codon:yes stop_codon:yes gene_type:complete
VKLLITGAAGQLGQAFVSALKQRSDIEFIACNRNDLDITNANNVRQVITQAQPDFVINTAAYTQVDLAESEMDKAYLVNQTGAASLAQVCQQLDIPLLHFSTDCVFDGKKQGAYTENDPTEALGVYGASKLAGEKAVEQFCTKHLIFRVSWLFSEFGHNFVKTMLALGSTREQLRVVSDQIGKPTCAAEVVRVILEILPTLYNEFDSESDKNLDSKWGIYHLAQPDVISWHGFAQAIFSQVVFDREKLSVKEILPIPTSGYPTPAQRPANSALDSTKLQQTFGIALIDWQQSLAQTLSALEITESKNETAQSDE